MHQFQAKQNTAGSTDITEKRVSTCASGPTFKQLYHCKLSDDFTPTPGVGSEIEDESSSYAGDQSLHYYNFCSSFRQVLARKYSHLDELHLFGDTKGNESSEAMGNDIRGGMVVTDFQTDLKECTQLEEYKQFFKQKFSQYEGVTELQEHFEQWYNDSADMLVTPDQLYQEIINQVVLFCYYLIDTRLHAVESFEQYEQDIYRDICSYTKFANMSSSHLSSQLAEIARRFEGRVNNFDASEQNENSSESQEENSESHFLLILIKNLIGIHQRCGTGTTQEAQEMRESILEVEIELYDEIVEVLSITSKATDQVKQYFSSRSGINHFAYFHHHLSRMSRLLSIVVNPYNVLCEPKDTHSIYTVSMSVGSVSGALSAFSEWLDTSDGEYSLKKGDVLRLCSDNVLYLDSDIRHEHLVFQGVNIALISPRIECKKQGKVCINTDGKPLDIVDQVEAAASGRAGTEDEKDGRPGKDGENGCYGNAGGHILIVSSNLCWDDFDLSAKGSRGQDGQNGGDGGDGWSPPGGGNGKDGDEPVFEQGRLRTHDSVMISYGTFGKNGGQGGDAGMGGAAGKAGVSGKIECIDLENEMNCKTSQEEVEDSTPGEPGIPGKAGKLGLHGLDWGKYASALWFGRKISTFVFNLSRPDYSIDSVRGDWNIL